MSRYILNIPTYPELLALRTCTNIDLSTNLAMVLNKRSTIRFCHRKPLVWNAMVKL